jgi:hypothetical protein
LSARQLPEVLDLVRGNTHLGTIEVKKGEADLPWYSGAFEPAPAFEAVRGLFERELEMLQANTDDDDAQWDDWEAVHEELHEPGLHLRSPDKAYTFGEFLIHIKGTEAWWRAPDDGGH